MPRKVIDIVQKTEAKKDAPSLKKKSPIEKKRVQVLIEGDDKKGFFAKQNQAVDYAPQNLDQTEAKKASLTLPKREKMPLAFKFPSTFKVIIFAMFFFGLIVAFLFFHFQAKAIIFLTPTTESISLEKEIIISPSAKDNVQNDLTWQVIDSEQEIWQEFKASGPGELGSKAKGVILLYNSFKPPRSFNFVVGTRFLSSKDNKVFVALNKIQLPPAKLEGGKIAPSVIEVPVQAQQTGEDYNIESAKFSLPGLSGTIYYASVTGESTQKMSGGSSKETKRITDQDISLAANDLEKTLLNKATADLKQKAGVDFLFHEQSIVKESFDYSCSPEQGELANDFNCFAKIKAKTAIFNISQVKNFCQETLKQEIAENEAINEKSLAFSLIGVRQAQGGSWQVSFSIKADKYQSINQQELLAQIRNLKKDEFFDAMDREENIKVSKIKFWPFWIRKIPNSQEKIEIQLTF